MRLTMIRWEDPFGSARAIDGAVVAAAGAEAAVAGRVVVFALGPRVDWRPRRMRAEEGFAGRGLNTRDCGCKVNRFGS